MMANGWMSLGAAEPFATAGAGYQAHSMRYTALLASYGRAPLLGAKISSHEPQANVTQLHLWQQARTCADRDGAGARWLTGAAGVDAVPLLDAWPCSRCRRASMRLLSALWSFVRTVCSTHLVSELRVGCQSQGSMKDSMLRTDDVTPVRPDLSSVSSREALHAGHRRSQTGASTIYLQTCLPRLVTVCKPA